MLLRRSASAKKSWTSSSFCRSAMAVSVDRSGALGSAIAPAAASAACAGLVEALADAPGVGLVERQTGGDGGHRATDVAPGRPVPGLDLVARAGAQVAFAVGDHLDQQGLVDRLGDRDVGREAVHRQRGRVVADGAADVVGVGDVEQQPDIARQSPLAPLADPVVLGDRLLAPLLLRRVRPGDRQRHRVAGRERLGLGQERRTLVLVARPLSLAEQLGEAGEGAVVDGVGDLVEPLGGVGELHQLRGHRQPGVLQQPQERRPPRRRVVLLAGQVVGELVQHDGRAQRPSAADVERRERDRPGGRFVDRHPRAGTRSHGDLPAARGRRSPCRRTAAGRARHRRRSPRQPAR